MYADPDEDPSVGTSGANAQGMGVVNFAPEAVVEGSAPYTGAPFYAVTAALQTGADLATIFTAHEAALPIKCYSPNLWPKPSTRRQTLIELWHKRETWTTA